MDKFPLEDTTYLAQSLCFYSGLEVVPLTHAGSAMLSFDQGNPTLKSDDPGQTWQITTWFMNCYKGGMSPVAFIHT